MGIEEITEAFDAAIGIVNSLADAKADGEISKLELLKAAMVNAPAVIKGVMGIDKAIEEAKDLDKAELEVIATKGLQLMQLWVVFSKRSSRVRIVLGELIRLVIFIVTSLPALIKALKDLYDMAFAEKN